MERKETVATLLCFHLCVVAAWAGELVRKPGSDYRLPIDFPVLEIKVDSAVPNLHAWADDGDGQWHHVFDSRLYGEEKPAHDPGARIDRTLFKVRLAAFPDRVQISLIGQGAAQVGVDGFVIRTASGVAVAPRDLKPSHDVVNGLNADVLDGQLAALPNAAPSAKTVFRPDSGIVGLRMHTGLAEEHRRVGGGEPVYVGIYVAPYEIVDPAAVPSTQAGITYKPPADLIAKFDFSVIQGNNYRVDFSGLMRRIHELNPRHRFIVRVNQSVWILRYFYDRDDARAKMVEEFADNIDNRAATELIHAVAISEEEMGNAFGGLYWAKKAPGWVKAFEAEYREETGREFNFTGSIHGDQQCAKWLGSKISFCYNDLYDRLKTRWPDMKFLQYMSIPSSGSGISWVPAGELKSDGWIYWNYRDRLRPMLMPCARKGAKGAEHVWMRVDESMYHLQTIRETGVPNAEVYHCGFAHQSGWLSVTEQIERARAIGVRYVWFYLPALGFVDPPDDLFEKHPELSYYPAKKPGKGWELYLGRRREMLKYIERRRELQPPMPLVQPRDHAVR